MKRAFVVPLLAMTATSLTLGSGAPSAGATDTAGGCVLPTAERSYTHDQLTYRLAVDLTDCDWWDGTPIQLDASLDRVDPAGGHGAGSFTLCGSRLVTSTDDDAPSEESDHVVEAADPTGRPEPDQPEGAVRTRRDGACAVEVSVDHPSVDGAHYKGAITFPWQGGRRTVSFNAVCQQTTGCVDLPADPTTLLTPAAEFYDSIVGGDDSAG